MGRSLAQIEIATSDRPTALLLPFFRWLGVAEGTRCRGMEEQAFSYLRCVFGSCWCSWKSGVGVLPRDGIAGWKGKHEEKEL